MLIAYYLHEPKIWRNENSCGEKLHIRNGSFAQQNLNYMFANSAANAVLLRKRKWRREYTFTVKTNHCPPSSLSATCYANAQIPRHQDLFGQCIQSDGERERNVVISLPLPSRYPHV